jgi:hypothetical protein
MRLTLVSGGTQFAQFDIALAAGSGRAEYNGTTGAPTRIWFGKASIEKRSTQRYLSVGLGTELNPSCGALVQRIWAVQPTRRVG